MTKKCAILFSGGKDSTYAAYLAEKKGYELTCLISVLSENKDSYMFHTPSIKKTKKQAEAMEIPLIIGRTKGKKEEELEDLKRVIKKAKDEYGVNCLVTGALHSVYQASRIQKICNKLGIECFNPLWHKNEFEYLEELIKNKFKIIITGVAAYPLDESWLGREINKQFIEDARKLNKLHKIHPAGEGGEFETFVLNCPLFNQELKIAGKKIFGEDNAWRMEIEVE